MFQEADSALLMGQLGREAQGLKKSPAVKSHMDVARLGNLQISEVLEVTLRMCPFKLSLLRMVEIQASKNAACCTDLFICLWDFMCHSEI